MINLNRYDARTADEIMARINAGTSEADILASMRGRPSPFFPYTKQQTGFPTLRGSEGFPMKILSYLADLPNPATGYEPPDDNDYPRCRLWKYLFHDNRTPLMGALPSGAEKKALLFNPTEGPTDEARGYRLYAQSMWGEAQGEQQTTIRVLSGRKIPRDSFHTVIAIKFLIFTAPKLEHLQQGVLRTEGIEQAIIESLNGIHIDGCGVCTYDRGEHPECGTAANLTDGASNIGREVTLAVTWVN